MDVTIIHPEKNNGEQKDLVRFDITTAAIEEMQRNYMALKINDINDKNGYKVVFNARQIVKNRRILVKKTADELENPYKDKINAIRAEEKRILGLLEPIEHYLQSEEDTYLKLIEDQKAQAARKEQQRIQERIDKLSQYGYRIDYSEIKSMTDIAFGDVLKQAEIKHNEEMEAKAEQEKLKKEQEEKFRQQQEELKRQQDALLQEQQKIASQKKAIEQQRQKESEERYNTRVKELEALGMIRYENAYWFGKDDIDAIRIPDYEIKNSNASDWHEWIMDISNNIQANKQQQAEQKCLAEEEEKKRVEVLKPDSDKLTEFAEKLSFIKYPECKDKESINAIKDAKIIIENLRQRLLQQSASYSVIIAHHDRQTNSIIVENGNHAK